MLQDGSCLGIRRKVRGSSLLYDPLLLLTSITQKNGKNYSEFWEIFLGYALVSLWGEPVKRSLPANLGCVGVCI